VAGQLAEQLDPGDELDLEGMDYAGGYLWFIGSHSDVRTRVKAVELGTPAEHERCPVGRTSPARP
jgi:hypothetical protein